MKQENYEIGKKVLTDGLDPCLKMIFKLRVTLLKQFILPNCAQFLSAQKSHSYRKIGRKKTVKVKVTKGDKICDLKLKS